MGLFPLPTMEKYMLKRWPLLLAVALLPLYASAQSSLTSFLPQKDLGLFLASNFDLHSIRSSFGPRHATGLHSFADFGLKPHKVTADSVEFREDEWLYRLTIGARGDMNSDGIEDVVVCLFEQREGVGGYLGDQALLLTRYSATTPVIAIRFEVEDCAKSGK